MDLDTWVSLGSLAVAFIGLGGLVLSQGRSLGDKIDQNHAEAKADHRAAMSAIETARAEARADHQLSMDAIERARTEAREAAHQGRTEAREAAHQARTESRADHNALAAGLSVLEQRTYDLNTRLVPPATERPTG